MTYHFKQPFEDKPTESFLILQLYPCYKGFEVLAQSWIWDLWDGSLCPCLLYFSNSASFIDV